MNGRWWRELADGVGLADRALVALRLLPAFASQAGQPSATGPC